MASTRGYESKGHDHSDGAGRASRYRPVSTPSIAACVTAISAGRRIADDLMKASSQGLYRIAAAAVVLGALSIVEVAQVFFIPNAENVNRADRPVLFMLWACLSFWLSAAVLLPVVSWLSRRYPLYNRRRLAGAAIHTGASLLFSLTFLAGGHFIQSLFWMNRPFLSDISYQVNMYFVYGVIIYWGALGFFTAIDYHAKAHNSELAASDLEKNLYQAQLQALRSRLEPHFLFNAMQSISGLALTGEREQVVEMLGRLSQLLRRSIDELSDIEIPLKTELSFLDDYIAIQLMRFPERLHFTPTIAPEALDALVPPMVLQPLIENAVEHGIASTSEPGRINLIVSREGDFLHMEVHDTGPGFNPKKRSRRAGSGIGLECTRQRLHHLYGDSHRLECVDLPERGACVIISIPFHGNFQAEEVL